MFKNLFPSFAPKKVEPKQVLVAEDDGISIEQKIYNDVYSAEDLIMAEVHRTLDTALKFDHEKHNRLKELIDLGFGNAEQISAFKISEEKKKEAESLKKQLDFYKQMYPLNKFIDRDSVERVCKKYKLILTEVSDYISDIPEKNQKEIVSFRFRQGDYRKPEEMDQGRGFDMYFFPRPYYIYDLLETAEDKKRKEDCMIKGKDLLIIAPAHKLNLTNKNLDGHIAVRKIKDPIVLQPVNAGYLIVSSWGLEASDPEIINPIQN